MDFGNCLQIVSDASDDFLEVAHVEQEGSDDTDRDLSILVIDTRTEAHDREGSRTENLNLGHEQTPDLGHLVSPTVDFLALLIVLGETLFLITERLDCSDVRENFLSGAAHLSFGPLQLLLLYSCAVPRQPRKENQGEVGRQNNQRQFPRVTEHNNQHTNQDGD